MFPVRRSELWATCLLLLCLQIALAVRSQSSRNYRCPSYNFKCKSGECIQSSRKCDGTSDCSDGSDELFTVCHKNKCGEDKFRCTYGGCIDAEKQCDNRVDCRDGSDESDLECSSDANTLNSLIRGDCNNPVYTQFQCRDRRQCIPFMEICNGIADCNDGSDETHKICATTKCHEGTFKCEYGGCIADSGLCDHQYDCVDKSDEALEICSPGAKEWYATAPDTKTRYTPLPIWPSTPTVKPKEGQNKGCEVTGSELRVTTQYNDLPYPYDGVIPHDTTVKLKCSRSFTLVGEDVNTCKNGKWRVPLAECEKSCPRSHITNKRSFDVICTIENEIVDCSEATLMHGTVATITCAKGYKPATNVTQSSEICTSTGQWKKKNQKLFDCVPDCGRIFDTVKEHPWLVSIFRHTALGNYTFQCLGTIVTPSIVLTAPDCISADYTEYSIIMGNHSANFTLDMEHGYEVESIQEIQRRLGVAIIVMVNPFVLSARVRPVCFDPFKLKSAPEMKTYTPGEPVVALNRTYTLTYIYNGENFINVQNNIQAIKRQWLQIKLRT